MDVSNLFMFALFASLGFTSLQSCNSSTILFSSVSSFRSPRPFRTRPVQLCSAARSHPSTPFVSNFASSFALLFQENSFARTTFSPQFVYRFGRTDGISLTTRSSFTRHPFVARIQPLRTHRPSLLVFRPYGRSYHPTGLQKPYGTSLSSWSSLRTTLLSIEWVSRS